MWTAVPMMSSVVGSFILVLRTNSTKIDSWIGHTRWKDPTNITKQALEYNSQGKLKNTRNAQKQLKTIHGVEAVYITCMHDIKALVQKQVRWKAVADTPYFH